MPTNEFIETRRSATATYRLTCLNYTMAYDANLFNFFYLKSLTSIRFVVGKLEYGNGAGFLVVSDLRNLCQNIGFNILKVD